jgi:SPP1 gp7 family putative phage head morphogenesis protein
VIEKRGSRWYVLDEGRTRVLGGPYDSKAEAEKRLGQIEYFKAHKDAAPDAALQTARRALALRAVGLGKRRMRLPRQHWPKLLEGEYARSLVGLLEPTRDALSGLRRELPALVDRARAERGDGLRVDAGETGRLRELMAKARDHLEQRMRPTEVEALAEQFGRRTQSYQRVQLGRQVRSALGADVFASDARIHTLLEHFVHENAILIKTIPHDVLDGVEKLASRAFTGAQQSRGLAEAIDHEFDVGESHARLIARDQIGKLYGQTNAYRQQDLGITSFIWRTAGDERVRPEHEDLDGQEFSYDDPPEEGLPGEPIQCRCYAEPVIASLASSVREAEE